MNDGISAIKTRFLSHFTTHHWRTPNNGVYRLSRRSSIFHKLLLVHFVIYCYCACKHTYRYVLSITFYYLFFKQVLCFYFFEQVISI